MLYYLTLLNRNLKLKYLMMRNCSNGIEVLELEDSVFNGRAYWDNKTYLHKEFGTVSEKVIH